MKVYFLGRHQEAKTAWYYFFIKDMKQLTSLGVFMNTSDICRPWWLTPTNFSKTAYMSPDFQEFLKRPKCREELEKQNVVAHLFFCDKFMEVTDRVLSTDVDSVLRNKHALLPPCQWETVQMTQLGPTLYSVAGNDQKIRFMVTFDHEVEIFHDKLAYSQGALVNNICGVFGLYMGIGVLELMAIMDRGIMIYFGGSRKTLM
jgi:hypothetical protein